jgi:hypothetical protein
LLVEMRVQDVGFARLLVCAFPASNSMAVIRSTLHVTRWPETAQRCRYTATSISRVPGSGYTPTLSGGMPPVSEKIGDKCEWYSPKGWEDAPWPPSQQNVAIGPLPAGAVLSALASGPDRNLRGRRGGQRPRVVVASFDARAPFIDLLVGFWWRPGRGP